MLIEVSNRDFDNHFKTHISLKLNSLAYINNSINQAVPYSSASYLIAIMYYTRGSKHCKKSLCDFFFHVAPTNIIKV